MELKKLENVVGIIAVVSIILGIILPVMDVDVTLMTSERTEGNTTYYDYFYLSTLFFYLFLILLVVLVILILMRKNKEKKTVVPLEVEPETL
jgi:hypothetical protein